QDPTVTVRTDAPPSPQSSELRAPAPSPRSPHLLPPPPPMASWLGSLWGGSASASLPYNIQSDPRSPSTKHGSHGWAIHDATSKKSDGDGGGEASAFQASKAELAKAPLRKNASLADARYADTSQTQLMPAVSVLLRRLFSGAHILHCHCQRPFFAVERPTPSIDFIESSSFPTHRKTAPPPLSAAPLSPDQAPHPPPDPPRPRHPGHRLPRRGQAGPRPRRPRKDRHHGHYHRRHRARRPPRRLARGPQPAHPRRQRRRGELGHPQPRRGAGIFAQPGQAGPRHGLSGRRLRHPRGRLQIGGIRPRHSRGRRGRRRGSHAPLPEVRGGRVSPGLPVPGAGGGTVRRAADVGADPRDGLLFVGGADRVRLRPPQRGDERTGPPAAEEGAGPDEERRAEAEAAAGTAASVSGVRQPVREGGDVLGRGHVEARGGEDHVLAELAGRVEPRSIERKRGHPQNTALVGDGPEGHGAERGGDDPGRQPTGDTGHRPPAVPDRGVLPREEPGDVQAARRAARPRPLRDQRPRRPGGRPPEDRLAGVPAGQERNQLESLRTHVLGLHGLLGRPAGIDAQVHHRPRAEIDPRQLGEAGALSGPTAGRSGGEHTDEHGHLHREDRAELDGHVSAEIDPARVRARDEGPVHALPPLGAAGRDRVPGVLLAEGRGREGVAVRGTAHAGRGERRAHGGVQGRRRPPRGAAGGVAKDGEGRGGSHLGGDVRDEVGGIGGRWGRRRRHPKRPRERGIPLRALVVDGDVVPAVARVVGRADGRAEEAPRDVVDWSGGPVETFRSRSAQVFVSIIERRADRGCFGLQRRQRRGVVGRRRYRWVPGQGRRGRLGRRLRRPEPG
ncbi:hypothetical protein ACHAWF_016374, partial [Thalassiosira exigua]